MALHTDNIMIRIHEHGDTRFQIEASGFDEFGWELIRDTLNKDAHCPGTPGYEFGLRASEDLDRVITTIKQDVHLCTEKPLCVVVRCIDNAMASFGFSLRRRIDPIESEETPLMLHLGVGEMTGKGACTELHFERALLGIEPPAKKRKTLSSVREPVFVEGIVIDRPNRTNVQIIESDGSVTVIARSKIEMIRGHTEGLVDFHLVSGSVIQVRTPMRGESVVCEMYMLEKNHQVVTIDGTIDVDGPVEVQGSVDVNRNEL